MNIAELPACGSDQEGVRYYESQGLLAPRLHGNGYRDYDDSDVRLVQEVRSLNRWGIPVESTRPFLECLAAGRDHADDCHCTAAHGATYTHQERRKATDVTLPPDCQPSCHDISLLSQTQSITTVTQRRQTMNSINTIRTHLRHEHGLDHHVQNRLHHHGPGRRRRGGFGSGGDGPRGFEGPDFPGERGFGGPRGPHGRRGHRGRRSRGDIRLAVLALLSEQPRHGYEIIQEIAERTSGAWRPSPGSVYPAIQQLEDEGLVRTEEADGRRTVHLTESGQQHVGEHSDELERVWASAERDEVNATVTSLRDQYGLLHAAVLQIASAGTDAQRETAATALAEARKTIYRLLAED